MIEKSKILVIAGLIAGAIVLAGSGYAAGKFFANKRDQGNFVRLEDGRRMRWENRNPFTNGQQPDMMGRIKSVEGGTIVLEKFAMPSNNSKGNGSSGGGGQTGGGMPGSGGNMPSGEGGVSEQAGSSAGTKSGNGPQLQIEGEVTITLSDNAEILKNARSLERSPMRDRNSNSEPEKISSSDLKQGDMVSVWLADGQDGVAEKVMVRGTGNN